MQATEENETTRRVQIENLHGEKWKSTCVSPHGEISIVERTANSEFWILEKHETESLWSFCVPLSDNLHVECDEAARGTTNMAVELKNRASKLFENFKAATDKLKQELQQKTSQDHEDHQQQQSTDKLHGSYDGTPVLTSDIIKKYYVTYNKKSDGDPNVTLELPHDNDTSMTRYFHPYHRHGSRLALQPRSSPGMFLGIKNGVLTVIEQEFKEEDDWVMAGSTTLAHQIQVGSGKGMKWRSNIAEGDHIPIVDEKDQFWWLERADEDSLWSFYIMSGTERLYVSYNGSDLSDPNVTLKPADESDKSKERYFRARLYASGRLRLHPELLPEKVIGIVNGVLALVDSKEQSEEEIILNAYDWVIDLEVKKGDSQGECIVYLKRVSHAQWVMHAENGDNVPVGTSVTTNDYEWQVDPNSSTNTFWMPGTEPPLYISKEREGTEITGIILSGQPEDSKLMKFTRVKDYTKPGAADTFKSVADDNQYIGVNKNQQLELVAKSEAVAWDTKEITNMIFMINDEEVIFPPLPNFLKDLK